MTKFDREDFAAKVAKSVKRRRRFEACFRSFGLFSVGIGLFFLSTMMVQIVNGGIGAFKQTYVYLEVEFDPHVLGMVDPTDEEQLAIANFNGVIRKALEKTFPRVDTLQDKRLLSSIVSVTATFEIREMLVADPSFMRKAVGIWVLADDDVDILFKRGMGTDDYQGRLHEKHVEWVKQLADMGVIETRFNTLFFTAGDSAEAEAAGIWGALMGSLLTLGVTFILSFPIGVASAIYLEEYAPRNTFTDFIEVNINNLAAVPSVIFGLLGLAVFLNWFGMPRSVPLVGGIVLTLMTLPTIIISSRASIKSVPQSIRDAAFSMGASKMQVILHHVLPIAIPGMLTGSIIGLAQALGETAPLLMIGMVAFIVDVPNGILDSATVLPVQIFLWADAPERVFIEKSSAAIMVLLGFLITMNATAVWLRRKLEKRL